MQCFQCAIKKKNHQFFFFFHSVHHLLLLLSGLTLHYATNYRTKWHPVIGACSLSCVLLQMLEQLCASVHKPYKLCSHVVEMKRMHYISGAIIATERSSYSSFSLISTLAFAYKYCIYTFIHFSSIQKECSF